MARLEKLIGQNKPTEARPSKAPVIRSSISEAQFRTMMTDVDRQAFARDKISVFRKELKANYMTAAQAALFLGRLVHSADRMEAIGLMAGRIIDLSNIALIEGALYRDSDKAKARTLLGLTGSGKK